MPREGPIRLKAEALGAPLDLYSDTGTLLMRITQAGLVTIAEAAGSIGFFGGTPTTKPTAYTQTYATAAKTVPAATQLAAPAGGVGTAAGGYDTAANRDLAITSINAAKTDIEDLKKVVNALIDDLQALGLVG